ncbi:MAG: hypothetical protein ABJC66_02315 [Gammaproteobacteria bacterium]
MLLTCFGAAAAVATRLWPANDVSLSFALYGALHALALVLGLRTRQTLWRMALFIGVAAALSVLTLQAGFMAFKWFANLPGNSGLYAALGFAAMLGALAYGLSIRQFKMYEFPAGSMMLISLGCVAAEYGALFTLAHFHALGRWWLAVLWWYAFSAGLWYHEHPRPGKRLTTRF